jgi:hypothetical protein
MAIRVLSFDVGTKNLAVCDLAVKPDGAFKVYQWSVSSCVPRGINVNKTPLVTLVPYFYKLARDSAKGWLVGPDGTPRGIQKVFIENQPMGGRGAARNLKTKVLSHILQTVLLEAAESVKDAAVPDILFVNPGLKLKDMPKPAEGRTTYRENKQYAIKKTTEYVTDGVGDGLVCANPEECKAWYVDKKMKKDDLADAFLQGLLAGHIYARGDVIPTPEDKPKKRAGAKKAAAGAAGADGTAEDGEITTDVEEKPKKGPVKRKRTEGPAEAIDAAETAETAAETAEPPAKKKAPAKPKAPKAVPGEAAVVGAPEAAPEAAPTATPAAAETDAQKSPAKKARKVKTNE